MNNKEVKFVRIRGRIIPIKNKGFEKKDIVNTGLVATGLGVSAGSGLYSANLFKKSYGAYNLAAHLRGLSKVNKSVGSKLYSTMIKDAAKVKVAANGMSIRAFGVASLGATIGSTLAGYGALNLTKDRANKETSFGVASALATIGSGLGLAILAKKAKVGHIAKAFTVASPKSKVSDAFKVWSNTGSMRTANLVNKYDEIAKRINKDSLKKINKARKKINPNQLELFK